MVTGIKYRARQREHAVECTAFYGSKLQVDMCHCGHAVDAHVHGKVGEENIGACRLCGGSCIQYRQECICHSGFGMNLSCPIHGVKQ